MTHAAPPHRPWTKAGAWLRNALPVILTLLLIAGGAWLLVLQFLAMEQELNAIAGSMQYHSGALTAGYFTAIALGVLGLFAVAWQSRRGLGWLLWMRSWRPALLWLAGLFGVIGVTSWVYASIIGEEWDLTKIVFDGLLLAMWGLWLLWLRLREGATRRRPRLNRLEKGLAGVLITIVLVEFACTAYDYRFFTTAFLTNTRSQQEFANFRELLRNEFFGYPFNANGYYDKEFYVAGEGDCVVAFVADSFGLGVVPYPFNVTTVAEEKLQQEWAGHCNRTDIFNFGVPKMAMKGYVQVLTHETPVYTPDLTVLCIFVGNDIFTADASTFVHSHLQNWRLYHFAKRQLFPYSRPEPIYRVPTPRDPALPQRIDDMGNATPPVPDYILDPSKEPARFPEALYWLRQRERLGFFKPEKPSIRKHYRIFFDTLDHIRETVQSPLLVVLAPDELQVDDAVWQHLMQTHDPDDFVRDLPQQRILDYAQRTGMAVVDLLPILRQAQQTDGHVYHLRDTHWNARGNQVAGEAIAKAILELYPGGLSNK